MATTLEAQEAGENDTGILEAETQFLFINMLEFLGEFETSNGEWISPDILANEAFTDLDGSASQAGGSDQRVLSATQEDDD